MACQTDDQGLSGTNHRHTGLTPSECNLYYRFQAIASLLSKGPEYRRSCVPELQEWGGVVAGAFVYMSEQLLMLPDET